MKRACCLFILILSAAALFSRETAPSVKLTAGPERAERSASDKPGIIRHPSIAPRVSIHNSSKKPTSVSVNRRQVTTAARKSLATARDRELSRWLLESVENVSRLEALETSRRLMPDGSVIIEGAALDQSTDRWKMREQVSVSGVLLQDEAEFLNGRKLIRTYHPSGAVKDIYYERNPDWSFSGSYSEEGELVEFTEKRGEALLSRQARD